MEPFDWILDLGRVYTPEEYDKLFGPHEPDALTLGEVEERLDALIAMAKALQANARTFRKRLSDARTQAEARHK
jgi:hypothetical protein